MLFDVIRERERRSHRPAGGARLPDRRDPRRGPGYAVVGVGRDDGGEGGEFSAILFRTERFHVADAGTFWFSDTPRCRRRNRGATTSRASARGRGSSIATAAGSITSTCTSITSRSRRASAARRCCGSGSTRARCRRAGRRHRRLQRRRENPALGRARARKGDAGTRRSSTRSACCIPTKRTSARSPASSSGNTDGDKIDYVLVQPGTEVMSAPRSSARPQRPVSVGPLSGHGDDPPAAEVMR